MEAKELGLRLRRARELAGLSQQAAADRMGLQRTAVTHWEAGSRSVSTLELVRLSELYHLHVSDILRLGTDDEDEDLVSILYRKSPMLENEAGAYEQIRHCIRLCRERVRLRRILGIETQFAVPPRYDVPAPRTAVNAITQGEQTAEQERNRLGIGSTPIPDVVELITSQGISASCVELPDGISGLFQSDRSVGLAILVNRSHSFSRKRFSYAHEYAHALLDRDRKIAVSIVDNSSPLLELRADAFAAAFLMPGMGVFHGLRNLGKGLPSRQEQSVYNVASGRHTEAVLRTAPSSQRITFSDITQLANWFGVNYSSVVYRLFNLRYLSNPEFRKLLKQKCLGREYLKAVMWSKDDPESKEQDQQDHDLRHDIAYLALEAYRRMEISRGRILELSRLLDLDGDSLLRFANSMRDE